MDCLTGVIQPYAWGSTTVIPALLGEEPTGEPQAELWLGAHPLAPSQIGGRPLDAQIASDPTGAIGVRSVATFGPRLPYLMKVLAAAQPLSLQAHPSREQAEAGYAREQAAGVPRDAAHRLYRDGWPKPEVLCALEPTEALCGFREPAETYELFARLGAESALRLVSPLREGGPEHLTEVFAGLLRLPVDRREVVNEVVRRAATLRDDPDLAGFAPVAVELASHYPGDPGILAALMMNHLVFGPYDAIYLPTGDLHAYLRGGGVEIMANSDNVMRGGLTHKHIDIDELLAVLDFRASRPRLLELTQPAPRVWRYQAPAPEFALWRVEPSDRPIPLPGAGTGRIVLVIEGFARLDSDRESLTLHRGQSAFVWAREDPCVQGEGVLFVGGPGL
jgi:mannose-6-phosphate isomerase